tara:strand:- start:11152 stop:11322 length:171 start_codon:yes stop_codon:yes gene_type:complete
MNKTATITKNLGRGYIIGKSVKIELDSNGEIKNSFLRIAYRDDKDCLFLNKKIKNK